MQYVDSVFKLKSLSMFSCCYNVHAQECFALVLVATAVEWGLRLISMSAPVLVARWQPQMETIMTCSRLDNKEREKRGGYSSFLASTTKMTPFHVAN